MNKLTTKILFLLFILSTSCSPIKIREMELDTIQELKGKVKKIKETDIEYSYENNDTVFRKTVTLLDYDKHNRLEKEIDIGEKYKDVTYFYYDNLGLLLYTASTYNDKIESKIEYLYDNNKNNIMKKELENNALDLIVSINYNHKNHIDEKNYSYPKHTQNNRIEKYKYDYKYRNFVIETFGNNEDSFIKIYYNKKGYLIKTESLNNELEPDATFYEYDKYGNLTETLIGGKDNKKKVISKYKYIFDKIGNVIKREHYFKGQLLEKTIMEIIYW